jgi:hypothetical protein
MMRLTQSATDGAFAGLLQWGIGGCILAVFVAPVFLLLVRQTQKREDERAAADLAERKLRQERENVMLDALVKSVEQQRVALEQQKAFEVAEERVHAAIHQGLAQITASLASITETLRAGTRSSTELTHSQERIAQLLQSVSERMERKP